jgi:hypothetical protein
MSTPIPPTQGTSAIGSAQSAGAPAQAAGGGPLRADDVRRVGARTGAAPAKAPSGSPAASLDTLDTFPSSPPQGVLDEMASAARVHDALRAQGRELRFAHDGQSGRMRIEVRDAAGAVLRTISPAQALDMAAGKPLE